MRQKLITSGCLIQTSRDDADYIVEARVGALGTDSLEVVYGLPANNILGQAASVLASAPAVPAIPEIAFGKRNGAMSTSKLVLFAYHRATGTPVWQSGSAIAKSDAKDSWIMGAGPVQRGSIYDGVLFAGTKLKFPGAVRRATKRNQGRDAPKGLTVAKSHSFVNPDELEMRLAGAAADSAKELAAVDSHVEPLASATESDPGTGVVQAGHDQTADE